MGLVLTLLVGAVTYQLLANNQRVSRGQTAHVSLQDNVRSGALIVTNELREVGFDDISATAQVKLGGFPAANRTDLVATTSTAVSYFAMRGLAFTCSKAGGKIVVRQSTYSVLRAPVSTDSLLVYVENDPATASDDAWVHLGITGAPANQNCDDGAAGWAFTVGYPTTPSPGLTSGVVLPNVLIGGPVRLAEVMRSSLYVSGGKSWLGMKSVTSANSNWEPVVGPLADSTASQQGLRFEYLNKTNATTATANDVRSIRVTLKGVTDERVRGMLDVPPAPSTP